MPPNSWYASVSRHNISSYSMLMLQETIDPDRLVSAPSNVKDLLCPICLELPLKLVQLKCEHMFCRADITEHLLRKNPVCPSCDEAATSNDIVPVGRFIQNTLNGLAVSTIRSTSFSSPPDERV